MNKLVINALRLDSEEKIIISKPFFESNSPTSRLRDIIDYKVITTKRIIFLRYFIRERRFQISDYFFLKDVQRLDFHIQHKARKGERLFYFSFTKVPVLSFSSGNESFELNLQGVMFLKRKINQLVTGVKEFNAYAEITVSWKRDDLGEACEELLYEGMSTEKKRRIWLILLVLGVVWILAVMRIFAEK